MGEALKKLRENARLSQAAVAEAMGIRQSTVAMWETGGNIPRTDKLPALAKLYGCTVDDLLKDIIVEV